MGSEPLYGKRRVARSALVEWLATPAGDRPRDCQNESQLCARLGIAMSDLVSLLAEPNLAQEVRDNMDHWKKGAHDVIAAIKRRAMDVTDGQQLRYAVAYLILAEHSGAEDIEALIEDGPGKRPPK